jgi:hypothetical protein
MADDGAMDEGTRVALRELAQRAEWGSTSQSGAEAEASRLRELGRTLAARVAADSEDSTWAHRAVEELAECCGRASAAWSADDVAELARLREAADIALAPGPGQPDPAPSARPRGLPSRASVHARFALPRGRRALVWGLAVLGCAAVAAIVIVGVGGTHNDNAGSGGSTADTQIPVGQGSTEDGNGSGDGTGFGASPGASGFTPSGTSTTSVSTAHVTAIQMTDTPATGYPEVQIYGTITASGTGDVTVTITTAGVSGDSPKTSTEDESGQTSYPLSQTIYLQQWCGQKSVTVTVSSGGVSSSVTVPVSGC